MELTPEEKERIYLVHHLCSIGDEIVARPVACRVAGYHWMVHAGGHSVTTGHTATASNLRANKAVSYPNALWAFCRGLR